MSVETFEPVVVTTFGGAVTLVDRSDLPQGVAASAKNIEFFPGAIRTRRGFDQYSGIGGTGTPILDFAYAYRSDGTQYAALGTLDVATSAYRCNVYDIQSQTSLTTYAPYYWDASANGLIRVFYRAYNRLLLAAVRNAGNAEFLPWKYQLLQNVSVASASPVSTRFSCFPPQASGTNYANSASVGNVSAGDHYFIVIYENSAGYRTAAMAPPFKLPATGSKKVDVTLLPIGTGNSATPPYDVAKRLIFATSANPALGGNQYPLTGYYCLETTASAMVVADNSTTSVSIDFSDAILVNGTPYTLYQDNWPLPPCKGFAVYNQRTVAWGVRNSLMPAGLSALQTGAFASPNMPNVPISFETGAYLSGPPSGWVTVTGGGTSALGSYVDNVPGQAWVMIGNGALTTPGKIHTIGDFSQGLTKGKEYRLRFRLSKFGTWSGGGGVEVSITGGQTVQILGSTLTTYGQAYDVKIVDYADTLSAGAYLNVGLYGTPANNNTARISELMIYPADTPFYSNTPWVSKAGQPEAFSNVTGFLGISDADVSQSVQCCFVLRSGLFMARETSVFGTQDNGTEPSTWPISKSSDVFGACGPRAVALIDDTGSPGQGAVGLGYSAGMALMVCRNGVSLFDGSSCTKVSQEIEPILAAVNWARGDLVWATADPARKKVFIGLPMGASTYTDKTIVVDYADGWLDPIENPGKGRKWSEDWLVGSAGLGSFGTVDPLDARLVVCHGWNGGALVKWPSSTPHYYDYSAGGSVNIATNYTTCCFPAGGWEQFAWGGLTSMVGGVGNFVLHAVLLDNSVVVIPQSGTYRTLSATALHDIFIKMHLVGEHISIQIQNGSNAGDYFDMDTLTLLMKPAPYAQVRGI